MLEPLSTKLVQLLDELGLAHTRSSKRTEQHIDGDQYNTFYTIIDDLKVKLSHTSLQQPRQHAVENQQHHQARQIEQR